MTALISGVDAEIEDVDLSKGEQTQIWFFHINPNHQVPAFDDDGEYMAESRDICRYFMDTYNKDSNNDHWYPKDPAKRQEVDAWLDWSKPLHLDIEKAVVISYVASQYGMPWREHYGCLPACGGAVLRNNESVQASLKRHLDEAEELVAKRNVKAIGDLNLGDLATIMEVAQAMECHPDYDWNQYPNLANLFSVVKNIPRFGEVYDEFADFCANFREIREADPQPSCATSACSVCTTLKFILGGACRRIYAATCYKPVAEPDE
jgi:glutathione S-transferase